MIAGVGTDLVEIDRVLKAIARDSFLQMCFTKREQEEAIRPVMLADDFAVKEAVAKALGTGFAGFTPLDIEVLRDEKGKPYVELGGKAKELAQGGTVHVSITNTAQLSSAFAVLER